MRSSGVLLCAAVLGVSLPSVSAGVAGTYGWMTDKAGHVDDIYWNLVQGHTTCDGNCPNQPTLPDGTMPWLYSSTQNDPPIAPGTTMTKCIAVPTGGQCCVILDPTQYPDGVTKSIDVSPPTCSPGLFVKQLVLQVQGGGYWVNYEESDHDWDWSHTLWTPRTCAATGAPTPTPTPGPLDNYCNLDWVALCWQIEIVPTTRRPTIGITQGDPRFVGFNGEHYTITGEADQVYNLMSDSHLQYNTRFITFGRTTTHSSPHPHVANVTFIGEVGLKWQDATGTEHRFHLNGYDPALRGLLRHLLREAPAGKRERSIFERHLNATAMQILLNEATRSDLLYLEFDGARVPLKASLPPTLTADARPSKAVELLLGVSYDERACGVDAKGQPGCRVRAAAGQNYVSVAGNTLPVYFYFSLVMSPHGELYLNERHELFTASRGAGSIDAIDDDEKANPTVVALTKNVHGLLGYTYRAADSRRHSEVNKWNVADAEAAAVLEGKLDDYSPSEIFADDFKFNQYQP